MDTRTRQRLLRKARTLMHLLEGHYGALPADADYGDILREGLDAAMALALPVVVRQAARKQRRAAEAVCVALEVYKSTLDDEPISVPSCWHEDQVDEEERAYRERLAANAQAMHAKIHEAMQEQWGIGRGLPTGEVL